VVRLVIALLSVVAALTLALAAWAEVHRRRAQREADRARAFASEVEAHAIEQARARESVTVADLDRIHLDRLAETERDLEASANDTLQRMLERKRRRP